MKQLTMPVILTICGALATAAFVAASAPASAQTATTSTTTSTTSTSTTKPKTTATPEMIEEATQRSKARFDKFVKEGVPENFGSEEPFTYTPK